MPVSLAMRCMKGKYAYTSGHHSTAKEIKQAFKEPHIFTNSPLLLCPCCEPIEPTLIELLLYYQDFSVAI